jgi:SAM-dependent methyltransferase
MTGPQLTYTGLDVLTALDEAAPNYNALLVELILRTAEGRRRMLDFGAGIGTFSNLLRKRGVEVACVETDAYLADLLAREGFTTFRDLSEVPEQSFEFIFSLNVLEHIADDRAVLRKLATKLAPGGRLLVYVPAFRILWTALDDKLKHYRRYRRSDLEALLHSARLRVHKSRYVDSLGFFATLLVRVFAPKQAELTRRAIAFYDAYLIPASKALDTFLGRWFGKNVYVVAGRDKTEFGRR